MYKIKTSLIILFLFICSIMSEEKSVSSLYQEALFIEETEGDIQKAIDYYKKIITIVKNDSLDSEKGEELIPKIEYQLGICYLKIGKKESAINHLKNVLKKFDGHDEIKNKARNYLQKINPELNERTTPLNLIATPWNSGEVMYHKLYEQNGGEIGVVVYSIENSTQNGIKTYNIKTSEIIPIYPFVKHTGATVKRSNLYPFSSYSKIGSSSNWRAKYKGNKIEYSSNINGRKTNNETTIELPIFDNEETIYLVRRLPLEVGYTDSALVFTNTNGMYVKGALEVTSIEEVETELGSFSCYKAEVSSSFQGDKNFEQTIWISTDKNRYVVKIKTGNSTLKLSKVTNLQNEITPLIDDERLDIKINLPSDYYYYNSLTTRRYKSVYQIFSPKTMAWCSINSLKRGKIDLTNRQIVDNDVKMFKKWFKKFKVRSDSWKTVNVNGISTIQYVVDVKYKYDQTAMTEYLCYYFTKDMVHLLVFRTNKENFQKDKGEFDKIIQTIIKK